MSLLEKIQGAGIVGAGGAGFPTHIKLNAQPEMILVNGAECEPLLRVDQQLMAVYAEQLAEALEAVRAESGAAEGIFALKGKYHEAINALTKVASDFEHIRVFELPNFYPAGDEQILVYEVTGRIIPEGGIPIAVGAVVLNVETLLNIYYAMEDIPVTESYLTVTGEVAHPCTIKVPLGITYREAIDLAGGALVPDPALIEGGPMMGKVTHDLDKPIVKTSKGLIVLSKDHPRILAKERLISDMLRQARTCCCHCMLCTMACPRHLLGHSLSPDKLMRIASYGKMCSRDSVTSAMLCSECGACEMACVMGLQPWKLNAALKQEFAANKIKNPYHATPASVDEFRDFRRMSIGNILARTGLTPYDVPAPLIEAEYEANHVELLLTQHIGASSVPSVRRGDHVKKGDQIAEAADTGPSVPLHASINGTVKEVSETRIILEN